LLLFLKSGVLLEVSILQFFPLKISFLSFFWSITSTTFASCQDGDAGLKEFSNHSLIPVEFYRWAHLKTLGVIPYTQEGKKKRRKEV